ALRGTPRPTSPSRSLRSCGLAAEEDSAVVDELEQADTVGAEPFRRARDGVLDELFEARTRQRRVARLGDERLLALASAQLIEPVAPRAVRLCFDELLDPQNVPPGAPLPVTS